MDILMNIFTFIALGVIGTIATFRSIGAISKLVTHVFNRIDREIEKAIED